MRLLFAIVAVGALARRQLCWQSPPPHPPAPRYTQHFTRFAPKLDIVWSRGWYNAFAPAGRIPLEYYNERGLDRRGWSVRLPTLLNSSECCGASTAAVAFRICTQGCLLDGAWHIVCRAWRVLWLQVSCGCAQRT
jgi:hypothetical protein